MSDIDRTSNWHETCCIFGPASGASHTETAALLTVPRSAVETGMVDWVLEVSPMPQRLQDYFQFAERLKLPAEDGPYPEPRAVEASASCESALRDVLVFLRKPRTGRDFTYYKRATVLRRIARRMHVDGVEDLGAYLNFLRTHMGEAGALLQDLLISVTKWDAPSRTCGTSSIIPS